MMVYALRVAYRGRPPFTIAIRGVHWEPLLNLGRRFDEIDEFGGGTYWMGSEDMPPLVRPKGALVWVEQIGQPAHREQP